jgi:hypothetical protein
MSPDPLPAAHDADGMGRYYKRIYNSALGKADAGDFAKHYRRYGLPEEVGSF